MQREVKELREFSRAELERLAATVARMEIIARRHGSHAGRDRRLEGAEREEARGGVTHDLLTRIGEALYGPNFRGALASDLGVDKRRLQRWCVGSERIPDEVAAEAGHLLREHYAHVATLVYEIR